MAATDDGYRWKGSRFCDVFEDGTTSPEATSDNHAQFTHYKHNNVALSDKYITFGLYKYTVSEFKNEGLPVEVAVGGSCPSPQGEIFYTLTTTGTDIQISRSSSGITIGSTTIGASSFRNGAVPIAIGVVFCGGGGGAGGNSQCAQKNSDTAKYYGTGGGGGGAATASALLVLSVPTETTTPNQFSNCTATINLGAGGSPGINATQDATNGGAGTDGGDSVLTIYDTESNALGTITAGGGKAGAYATQSGSGGVGASISDGSGGTAGVYSSDTVTSDLWYVMGIDGTAGLNRSAESGNTCTLADVKFFDAAVQTTTYTQNSGTSTKKEYTTTQSVSGGGASALGHGATCTSTAADTPAGVVAGPGGGGSSGLGSDVDSYRTGGNGVAYFYY